MHALAPRSFCTKAPAVFAVALCLVLSGRLSGFAAEEETQVPTAASAPAAGTTTNANGSTLFPDGTYTPAPELEENRAANRAERRAARGRRGQGGGQTGRANDVLSAKAATDPLEVRIAFRKAKTAVLLRHPELNAIEQQAADASTDKEKRAFLREYYTQLYAAVKKVDPSPAMVSHVDTLGSIAQQRYDPKRRVVGGDEDLVRGGGRRGRRR